MARYNTRITSWKFWYTTGDYPQLLGVRCFDVEYRCCVFFTNFNISALFHHDGNDLYRGVYVYDYPFSNAHLNFLN